MKFLSKVLSKQICVPLVLVIFMLLIILPPILNGYVYPNNGDDSAFHLRYFDSIKEGTPEVAMYLGRIIVGYPIVWMSSITGLSIDTLYLWFNYGTLCLIGIVAYLMVSLIFNWQAGLLTVPLVLFATSSTLNLFDNGAIFDLITVGILLPLFLVCMVYAVKTRIPWLWYSMALFPLLVFFHSSSLVSSVSVHTISIGGLKPGVPQSAESAWSIAIMMSRYLVIVGCVSFVFILQYYKKIKLNSSQKLLLLLVFMAIVSLAVLTALSVSGLAMRFVTDMCILLALFMGCIVGVLWQSIKSKAVLCLIAILIVFGSIPVATTYFEHNSAITPTDLKAIEYVNGLSGKYYSCSSEVAPWIYGRFLNKTYKEDSPLYIYRREPMTYTTTKDSPYFWGDKCGYILDKRILSTFSDGEGLQVVVWGNKEEHK